MRTLDVVVEKQGGVDDAVESHTALRVRGTCKCSEREECQRGFFEYHLFDWVRCIIAG